MKYFTIVTSVECFFNGITTQFCGYRDLYAIKINSMTKLVKKKKKGKEETNKIKKEMMEAEITTCR